jgi:methionyl-tRNA formyltransferase
MRLIFAGTPPFAATALDALVRAGHTVALVLTQPDRPSGRGMKLTESAVAKAAAKYSLRVEKPESLKSTEVQSMLSEQQVDVMVVVAYGMLLPVAVLELPKWGCLNIHASLLPRWRGAAPIQRAIEAGDALTGVSVMQMDAGLDTGAVLLEKRMPIEPDDNSASLFERLASLGAEAIVEALADYQQLKAVPQESSGITYAKKILKSEARIDWTLPAVVLERRMRAFDPFPGCECLLENEPLKVWRSAVVKIDGQEAQAGTVVGVGEKELVIQCGKGQLRLESVQRPGGRRLSISEFLHGSDIRPGMVLS